MERGDTMFRIVLSVVREHFIYYAPSCRGVSVCSGWDFVRGPGNGSVRTRFMKLGGSSVGTEARLLSSTACGTCSYLLLTYRHG